MAKCVGNQLYNQELAGWVHDYGKDSDVVSLNSGESVYVLGEKNTEFAITVAFIQRFCPCNKFLKLFSFSLFT